MVMTSSEQPNSIEANIIFEIIGSYKNTVFYNTTETNIIFDIMCIRIPILDRILTISMQKIQICRFL